MTLNEWLDDYRYLLDTNAEDDLIAIFNDKSTNTFKIFQHYCGFCMCGDHDGEFLCYRDFNGSWDHRSATPCNETPCPFMKEIKNKEIT